MGLRVSGLLISLLAQLYLARLLGGSEYGRYAIALGWGMLFVIITRRGLDDMALRVATHYREDGSTGALYGMVRYANRTMATIAVVILSVAVVIKLLVSELAAGLSWPMIVAVGAAVLPLSVLGFYSALLLSSGRVIASQVFEQMWRPLILIALLFAVHLIWKGPGSAEIAMFLTAASLIIAVLLAMRAWNRSLPVGAVDPSSADRKEWHSISSSFVIVALCQEGLNQAGILLLGILGTNIEAAHFAAAWRYNSLLAFGLAAVGLVSGPMIASAHRRSALTELALIVRTGAGFALAFGVAAAVVLVLFGRELLGLFGAGFSDAYPALLILLIGSLANASTGVVSYLLSLTGSHALAARIMVCALALCIAVNIVLIPRYGAVGAAIASAVTQFSMNVALFLFARRLTGVRSWPLP
jgi:O-antigen/teichoic acid export membrane protein